MNRPPQDTPPATVTKKPTRLAREAAALRANLLKRKEQARQREIAAIKPAR